MIALCAECFSSACTDQTLWLYDSGCSVFALQLVALLREVKYLNQLTNQHDIPNSASSVFQQNERFRDYLQSLDVIGSLYNSVRETILDVEYPLIVGQLADIDKQLERAVSELNWTSDGQ